MMSEIENLKIEVENLKDEVKLLQHNHDMMSEFIEDYELQDKYHAYNKKFGEK